MKLDKVLHIFYVSIKMVILQISQINSIEIVWLKSNPISIKLLLESWTLHHVPTILWRSVLVILNLSSSVQCTSFLSSFECQQVFICLNDHDLWIKPLLILNELLVFSKSLALCLILDFFEVVWVFTLLSHHEELLLFEHFEMGFDFLNGQFTFIYFYFLAPLLVDIWNIPCIQNIILKTLWMFRQCFQMVRSNKPISVTVLLLGHFIHQILLVHFGRQKGLVRSGDVFVKQLMIVGNGTKSLGWIELRSFGMPLTLLFDFTLKLKFIRSSWYFITFFEKVRIIAFTWHCLLALFLRQPLFLQLVFQLILVSLSTNWIRVECFFSSSFF